MTEVPEARIQAIREDLEECATFAELDAMVTLWKEEYQEVHGDGLCQLMVASTRSRLELTGEVPPTAPWEPQLEPTVRSTRPPVARRYVLLRTDVSWSTKPQVHAVMEIIKAHAKVGDILDEADIIRMMEANREALHTRQDPKRVFSYYKGNSDEGLMAHGNIKLVRE